MSKELLVDELLLAGGDFVCEFDSSYPVSVAFWVIPGESSVPYLYIASDKIHDSNIDVAYREVIRRFGAKRTRLLDPFQIKLVNTDNPIAQNAIEYRDRYPIQFTIPYPGSSMGGMGIDRAIIYAPIAELKATP